VGPGVRKTNDPVYVVRHIRAVLRAASSAPDHTVVVVEIVVVVEKWTP